MWKTTFLVVAIIGVFVEGNRFANHERVPLIANTVGPFNNPTETYPVSNSTSHSFLTNCCNSTIIFRTAEELANNEDTNKI